MANKENETERLQKILQGAFNGPPTPHKDIPTRWGKQRAERKEKPARKHRRQRKAKVA
jgi:hypothetical protein